MLFPFIRCADPVCAESPTCAGSLYSHLNSLFPIDMCHHFCGAVHLYLNDLKTSLLRKSTTMIEACGASLLVVTISIASIAGSKFDFGAIP